MTAAMVAERLGGEKVLRKEIRSELQLAEAVHEGLPVGAVDYVLNDELLEPSELYSIVVPRRTLTHRREKQQTLSPDQSDRLARAVRILARAEEALGAREKAMRWMRRENRAMGGRRPIELLDSDAGARIVERTLGRIEHGVYS